MMITTNLATQKCSFTFVSGPSDLPDLRPVPNISTRCSRCFRKTQFTSDRTNINVYLAVQSGITPSFIDTNKTKEESMSELSQVVYVKKIRQVTK